MRGLPGFDALCYTRPMQQEENSQKDTHQGHRARLRARFLAQGLSGFAPHEALELLLTFAIPRRDVNPLAHQLIRHFGSLKKVLEARPADLLNVPGVGEQAATLLSLLLPMFRIYQQEVNTPGQAPFLGETALSFCKALLMGEQVECFYVMALDARSRLIVKERLSSGDDGETVVYPRLVAQMLLRVGATGCVIAHNHPSGLVTPSRADIDLTRSLKDTLLPLGVSLLDHIIVAGDTAFSFLSNGLMG